MPPESDLRLPYVLDATHGVTVTAETWQSMTDAEQIQFLKSTVVESIDWREGEESEDGRRLLCPICGERAVPRRAHATACAHFAHAPGAGADCEWAKGGLSQEAQRAARYQGQRESAEHIALKREVAEWLQRTPEVTDVAIEQRVTGDLWRRWRQPDVSCVFRGQNLAIEIQRSSEYLRVLIERDRFYKERGWLVLYIFAPPADRLTVSRDEAFLSGSGGYFVFDDGARAASAERNELVVGFRRLKNDQRLACTLAELAYPVAGDTPLPHPYPASLPTPTGALSPRRCAQVLIEAARAEVGGTDDTQRARRAVTRAYHDFARSVGLAIRGPLRVEWDALVPFLARLSVAAGAPVVGWNQTGANVLMSGCNAVTSGTLPYVPLLAEIAAFSHDQGIVVLTPKQLAQMKIRSEAAREKNPGLEDEVVDPLLRAWWPECAAVIDEHQPWGPL